MELGVGLGSHGIYGVVVYTCKVLHTVHSSSVVTHKKSCVSGPCRMWGHGHSRKTSPMSMILSVLSTSVSVLGDVRTCPHRCVRSGVS